MDLETVIDSKWTEIIHKKKSVAKIWLITQSTIYKQPHTEIGQKMKQMLSNTLRLNFCYLKIIHILHARYHRKIIEDILKNVQKKSTSIWIKLYV